MHTRTQWHTQWGGVIKVSEWSQMPKTKRYVNANETRTSHRRKERNHPNHKDTTLPLSLQPMKACAGLSSLPQVSLTCPSLGSTKMKLIHSVHICTNYYRAGCDEGVTDRLSIRQSVFHNTVEWPWWKTRLMRDNTSQPRWKTTLTKDQTDERQHPLEGHLFLLIFLL